MFEKHSDNKYIAFSKAVKLAALALLFVLVFASFLIFLIDTNMSFELADNSIGIASEQAIASAADAETTKILDSFGSFQVANNNKSTDGNQLWHGSGQGDNHYLRIKFSEAMSCLIDKGLVNISITGQYGANGGSDKLWCRGWYGTGAYDVGSTQFYAFGWTDLSKDYTSGNITILSNRTLENTQVNLCTDADDTGWFSTIDCGFFNVVVKLSLKSPDYQGGNGQEGTPYLLKTREDFDILSSIVETNALSAYSGKYFKVNASSISFGSSVFRPIGTNAYPFKGNIDFNGVTITGLNVNTSASAGLFGYVTGGSISNSDNKAVTLYGSVTGTSAQTGTLAGYISNAYIKGAFTNYCKVSGVAMVGGLLGQSHATVTNAVFINSGAITGSGDSVGGVAGFSEKEIKNAENKAAVKGAWAVGGIVGRNQSVIDGCINSGGVTATGYGSRSGETPEKSGAYAGGITGYTTGGSISNCYNSGTVAKPDGGTNDYIGGIAGYAKTAAISYCYNKGTIKGATYIGGIVGYSDNSVSYCYNDSAIESTWDSASASTGTIKGNANGSNTTWDLLKSATSGFQAGAKYSAGKKLNSGLSGLTVLPCKDGTALGNWTDISTNDIKQFQIDGITVDNGSFIKSVESQSSNTGVVPEKIDVIGSVYNFIYSATSTSIYLTTEKIATSPSGDVSYYYNGFNQTPYSVTPPSGYDSSIVYTDSGKDIAVTPKNAGEYTVSFKISLQNVTVGTATRSFTINPKQLSTTIKWTDNKNSASTSRNLAYNFGEQGLTVEFSGLADNEKLINIINNTDAEIGDYGKISGNIISFRVTDVNTYNFSFSLKVTDSEFIQNYSYSGASSWVCTIEPLNLSNLKVYYTGAASNNDVIDLIIQNEAVRSVLLEEKTLVLKNDKYQIDNFAVVSGGNIIFYSENSGFVADLSNNLGVNSLILTGTGNFAGTLNVSYYLLDHDFGGYAASGWGSKTNPYLIENWAHLVRLSEIVNGDSIPWDSVNGTWNDAAISGNAAESISYAGSYFKVNSDISNNVNGDYGFCPIGKSSEYYFAGVFDGGVYQEGNVTDRITINVDIRTAKGYTGLFGFISGATIKNLAVSGSVISEGGNATGGVVGIIYGYGTVESCINSADVAGNVKVSDNSGGQNVGGIVGVGSYLSQDLTVNLKNCLNSGIISGKNYVGGIAGNISQNVVIEYCVNQGGVSGFDSDSVSGAIVGSNGGALSYVYNLSSATVEICGTGSGVLTNAFSIQANSSATLSKGGNIIGYYSDNGINGIIKPLYKKSIEETAACEWDDIISKNIEGFGYFVNTENGYYLKIVDGSDKYIEATSTNIDESGIALQYLDLACDLFLTIEKVDIIDGEGVYNNSERNILGEEFNKNNGFYNTLKESCYDIGLSYNPSLENGLTYPKNVYYNINGEVQGYSIELSVKAGGHIFGRHNVTLTIKPYSLSDSDVTFSYEGTASNSALSGINFGYTLDNPSGVVKALVYSGSKYKKESFKLYFNSASLSLDIDFILKADGAEASDLPSGESSDYYKTLTLAGTGNFAGTLNVSYYLLDHDFGGYAASGWGSETKPYLIENWAHLVRLSEIVNGDSVPWDSVNGTWNDAAISGNAAESITYAGSYFKVNSDISNNVNGDYGFCPIGKSSEYYFAGVFDGGVYQEGNVTDRITINVDISTANEYTGLFGFISGATIKNLAVSGKISSTDVKYIGGIVGCSLNGTIENCINEANVTSISNGATVEYAGGIAGFNNGTIRGCFNRADIKGVGYVGGIAGYNNASIQDSAVNNSSITGSGNYVGGITGKNNGTIQNSSVDNCVVNGLGNYVDGSGYYVGGIAGENTASGKLFKCSVLNAESQINAQSGKYAGGIVGYSSGGIIDCISQAMVSGADYAGGIAGYLAKGCVLEFGVLHYTNSSTVRGANYVGGIAGAVEAGAGAYDGSNYIFGKNRVENDGKLIITKDSPILTFNNNGLVTASGHHAGGIFGEFGINNDIGGSGYTLYYAVSINTAAVTADGDYAGGIFGEIGGNVLLYLSGGSHNGSSNGSDNGITVSAKNYVGGLTGKLSDEKHEISNFYNTAFIGSGKTVNYAGGIVGFMAGGSVSNSFSTVPDNNASNPVVGIYFDTDRIKAADYAGGIAGYFEKGALENCYSQGFSFNRVSASSGGVAGFKHATNATITNCWAVYVVGRKSGSSWVSDGMPSYQTVSANSNGNYVIMDARVSVLMSIAELENVTGTANKLSLGAGVPTTGNINSGTSKEQLQLVFYDVSGYERSTDNTFEFLENNNSLVMKFVNTSNSFSICLDEIVFQNVTDLSSANSWAGGYVAPNGDKNHYTVKYSSTGSDEEISSIIVGHTEGSSDYLITGNVYYKFEQNDKIKYILISSFSRVYTKGSSAAPIIISDLGDWKTFVNAVKAGEYKAATVNGNLVKKDITVKLTNDIDLSQTGILYLAGDVSRGEDPSISNLDGKYFSGTFDGNGNTIRVAIDNNSNRLSVFPNAAYAEFKNLIISGSVSTTGYDISAFVGKAFGTLTFENCVSDVDITARRLAAGFTGFVLQHEVNLIGCTNSGNIQVSGDEWNWDYDQKYGVGGLVAKVGRTITIESCKNTGSINGPANAGGLVGIAGLVSNDSDPENISLTINNSANTGTVSTTCRELGTTTRNGNSGGIIGYATEYATVYVYASYNTGAVSTNGCNAGGIIGADIDINTNGYSFSNLDKKSNYQSIIAYCYNTGNISTGVNGSDGNGGTQSGGVVGTGARIKVLYCYNTGKVTVYGINDAGWVGYEQNLRVGGIVGYTYYSDGNTALWIEQCYSVGDIYITRTDKNARYAGGILGMSYDEGISDSSGKVVVKNCYSKSKQIHYDNGTYDIFHGNSGSQNTSSSGNVLALNNFIATYSGGVVSSPSLNSFGSGSSSTLIDSNGNYISNKNSSFKQGKLNGWIFPYGCLPQLAVFALDTYNGLSMLSTNYGLNTYGNYVEQTAGDEFSPYIIKDGVDMLSLAALVNATGGSSFWNGTDKFIEFADITNTYDQTYVRSVNLESLKFNDSLKGKNYHLLTAAGKSTVGYFYPIGMTFANLSQAGTISKTYFGANISGERSGGGNVEINNLNVRLQSINNIAIAGLFGYTQGAAISDITVSGYVSASATNSVARIYAGGIAGMAGEGTVLKNLYAGTVSANAASQTEEALTAANDSGTMDVSISGSFNGTVSAAGGIVGHVTTKKYASGGASGARTELNGCVSYADVTTSANNAGGIWGYASGTGSTTVYAENCSVSGGTIKTSSISGANIGGIGGGRENSAFTLALVSCNVGDKAYLTPIDNVDNANVKINGANGLGGILAYVNNNTTLSNCSVYGDVSMSLVSDILNSDYGSAVGGIIGYSDTACVISGTTTFAGRIDLGSYANLKNIGGIFGYMGAGTTISSGNINMVGKITASGSGENVGGVAGNSQGTESKPTVFSGDYTVEATLNLSNFDNIGGFIGQNAGYVYIIVAKDQNEINTISIGSVPDKNSTGSIKAKNYVGGFIGLNGDSSGIKIGETSFGGIIYSGKLEISNNASINGVNFVGGLFGQTSGGFEITKYATLGNMGSVSGETYVGGIIGALENSTVSGNYTNTGTVSANSYVGGAIGMLAGNLDNAVFINQGEVSAAAGDAVGGSIGIITGSEVKNTHFEYTTNAQTQAETTAKTSLTAGESGKDENGKIIGGVGGVIGIIDNYSEVSDSNTFYVNGSVTASGATYVGGVVGKINDAYVTISNMLVYKNIIVGKDYVGGIVGYNGSDNKNSGSEASLSNCYNINGEVIAASNKNVGGIVGGNNGQNYAYSCYWVKDFSNSALINVNIERMTETLNAIWHEPAIIERSVYINNEAAAFLSDEANRDKYFTSQGIIYDDAEVKSWTSWQNYIDKWNAAHIDDNITLVTNNNGDYSYYTEGKVTYSTGNERTGYYFIYANDGVSAAGAAAEIDITNGSAEIDDLSYWKFIADAYSVSERDSVPTEFKSELSYNEDGSYGYVYKGHIYATAHAATKNGYYLYMATGSGEGLSVNYSDANSVFYNDFTAAANTNVMVYYKKLALVTNLIYNGVKREAPLDGLTTDSTGVFGYYYVLNGSGANLNYAANVGSGYDINATIEFVDSAGRASDVGKINSVSDSSFKWGIAARKLEVETDTSNAGEYDGTAKFWVEFEVSNVTNTDNNGKTLSFSFTETNVGTKLDFSVSNGTFSSSFPSNAANLPAGSDFTLIAKRSSRTRTAQELGRDGEYNAEGYNSTLFTYTFRIYFANAKAYTFKIAKTEKYNGVVYNNYAGIDDEATLTVEKIKLKVTPAPSDSDNTYSFVFSNEEHLVTLSFSNWKLNETLLPESERVKIIQGFLTDLQTTGEINSLIHNQSTNKIEIKSKVIGSDYSVSISGESGNYRIENFSYSWDISTNMISTTWQVPTSREYDGVNGLTIILTLKSDDFLNNWENVVADELKPSLILSGTDTGAISITYSSVKNGEKTQMTAKVEYRTDKKAGNYTAKIENIINNNQGAADYTLDKSAVLNRSATIKPAEIKANFYLTDTPYEYNAEHQGVNKVEIIDLVNGETASDNVSYTLNGKNLVRTASFNNGWIFGGAINVGEYSISVKTRNGNYVFTGSTNNEWEIEAVALSYGLRWTDNSTAGTHEDFEYEAKHLGLSEISFNLLSGDNGQDVVKNNIEYTVTNPANGGLSGTAENKTVSFSGAVHAGTYKVSFKSKSGNYILTEKTVVWNITKAELSLSYLWTDAGNPAATTYDKPEAYIYNTYEQGLNSVTVNGLKGSDKWNSVMTIEAGNNGVTYLSSSNKTIAFSGAVFALTYKVDFNAPEGGNYTLSDSESWTIGKKVLKVEADEGRQVWVYDGLLHTVPITIGETENNSDGTFKFGNDVIAVSVNYGGGNAVGACNAGFYSASVNFENSAFSARKASDSSVDTTGNYDISGSTSVSGIEIEINPRQVSLSWAAAVAFVYKAAEQGPALSALGVWNDDETAFLEGFSALAVSSANTVSIINAKTGKAETLSFDIANAKSIDAGTYTATVSLRGINGENAAGALPENSGNFVLAEKTDYPNSLDYSIGKSKLNFTVNSIDAKIYDATTKFGGSISSYTLKSANGGAEAEFDSHLNSNVILSVNAVFENADVGTRKTVIFTPVLVGGGNYALTSSTYSYDVGEITERLITVSVNTYNNKAYKAYNGSDEYAVVQNVSGQSDAKSASYRRGQGLLATGFAVAEKNSGDIIISARFAEADALRNTFDTYVNNVVKNGDGTYSIASGYYKKLVFVMTGNKASNYSFKIDGYNSDDNADNVDINVFDSRDTTNTGGSSDAIYISIEKYNLSISYSNTIQSYANNDNSYNTDWRDVEANITSGVVNPDIAVSVVNRWKFEQDGVTARHFTKYTKIVGKADSGTGLGASLLDTSHTGLDLNYTLKTQPTLIIGYFISEDGYYQLSTVAGLLLATYYYQMTTTDPSSLGETVYKWRQLATAAQYDNNSGIPNDLRDADGNILTFTSWDDYFNAYIADYKDKKGVDIEIIYDSNDSDKGWGFWEATEVTMVSYQKFKLINNISGIITQSDIAIIAGQFGDDWGTSSQNYLKNVIKMSSGNTLTVVGGVFTGVFGGVFDGNGYVIDGLNIIGSVTNGASADIGFFESVGNVDLETPLEDGTTTLTGSVNGLNLRNVSITVYASGYSGEINVGGIAGYSTLSTIMANVSFHGNITVTAPSATINAGGIIGFNYSSVANIACLSNAIAVGNITINSGTAENNATAYAGGIVGKTVNGSGNGGVSAISDVAAMLEIFSYAANNFSGGLIGGAFDGGKTGENAVALSGSFTYLSNSVVNMNDGDETAFIARYIGNASDAASGEAYAGVSYDALRAGSSTLYGADGFNCYAEIAASAGEFDVIANERIAEGSAKESLRLADIIDIYVLLYAKTAVDTTADGRDARIYAKESSSRLVGTATGTTNNAVQLAYQQHVALLRMFRFAAFKLNKDITMYESHTAHVFDGAFYGSVDNSYENEAGSGNYTVKLSRSGAASMFEKEKNKVPVS